jgi:hypothetical protein
MSSLCEQALTFYNISGVICLISCLKPNSIEDLRQRIRDESRQITPEMLQNARDAYYLGDLHLPGHDIDQRQCAMEWPTTV